MNKVITDFTQGQKVWVGATDAFKLYGIIVKVEEKPAPPRIYVNTGFGSLLELFMEDFRVLWGIVE